MQRLKNLILRLWQGNIIHEELNELEQCLAEDNEEFKEACKQAFLDLSPGNELDDFENPGRILRALHDKIQQKKKRGLVLQSIPRSNVSWAAAATTLVIVGILVFYAMHTGTRAINSVAKIEKAHHKSILKTTVNTGKEILQISLSDSSIVRMYPNSSITYEEAFNDTQRIVILSGMAFFKVHKNKAKPFTVFANGFTTTALGTEFTVDTRGKGGISVKLLEGKVVISSTEKLKNHWKDRYLLPGQELSFNSAKNDYEVIVFNQAIQSKTGEKKYVRKPDAGIISLVFDSEPLKKVIKRLQAAYGVKISFKQVDIEGRFFTGTFSRSEDIKNILSDVCSLNGLTYEMNGDHIAIKKPVTHN